VSRVGERARGVLEWLERLAERRLGALVLFACGLAVYAVRAVAWPLRVGRDLDEYLYFWIQLFDRDTLLPWSMLFRTPGTPVVVGPLLDVADGFFAEPAAGVLYAGSIVAWSAAARYFGPRAALATAATLLLYPGYGAIFHELGSELVFAVAFAGVAFLLTRAAFRPSVARFVLAGLAVAACVLVRPGNVVLVALALFPLVVRAAWRRRLAWAGALAAAALLPLAAWTVHNGLRYDEWALARGGNAVLPFYRAFLTDRIVSPEHGDASERLGVAVQQHLLTRDPYRSYGVTLEEVFSAGSARVHEDMYLLSDEFFGWDTDYAVLRDAAIEAIRDRPRDYASGVLHTIWRELSTSYYRLAPDGGEKPATIVVDGRRLPAPSEGQLIPAGQNLWISRPDNRIREEWTSATEHHFVFDRPSDRPRFVRIERERDELFAGLPDRSGNEALARRLSQASRWFPRSWLWLAVGLVAIFWRRPRGSFVLLALTGGALLVVGLNALGLPTDLHYLLPVAPAFVLLAFGALLGPKRPVKASTTNAGATGAAYSGTA
jgi:hypothetical protein